MKSFKDSSIIYAAFLFMSIAAFVGIALSQSSDAKSTQSYKPVEIVIFYSSDCEHCDSIKAEYLYPAMDKYGERLDVELYDVDDRDEGEKNFERLLEYENQYDDHGNDFPTIIMAGKLLGNTSEIRPVFNELLQKELAKQAIPDDKAPEETSVDTLDIVQTDSVEAIDDTVETEVALAESDFVIPDTTIHIVYFKKIGCESCSRVARNLKHITSKYPNIEISTYDVENPEGATVSEYLSTKHDIPYEQHLVAPAIFVGDGYLLLDDIQVNSTLELISQQGEKAAIDISNIPEKDLAKAYERIRDNFQNISIWAIIGAGLIDGINPCAFGVIIFFITFLTVMKRSRAETLLTGISFTVAVFVTYFLVGVGILKFLVELKVYDAITNWIYLLMGLFVAILAILSIVDIYKTKKGKSKDMLLQLPAGFKKRIHKLIRKESKAKAKLNMVLAALSTGFLVSLMEMACTGQVYLPMITIMTQTPGARAKAIAYLLLYNFMFILPLVIIFTIAMAGVSSQKLGQFMEKNTYIIKILLALLFIGLGYYLLVHVDYGKIAIVFGKIL